MHLNGIFLLLLCISSVSPFSLSSLWTSLFGTDPVTTIINQSCSALAKNPNIGGMFIMALNNTLGTTTQTAAYFNNTLTYINNPINQQNLFGGTDTCPTFFQGLRNALVTDYQNAQNSLQIAQAQSLTKLTEFYNMLLKTIG